MKKIFRNSRLIAIAFFTVFSTSASPQVLANNHKGLPVELKYIGNVNNQTIFQLIVAGSSEIQDYTIIIRDPFGNSIFKENIKADNFTKKFLFDTDELGDDVLQFEIFCRKTNKTVLYNISRQSRYLEEVIVSQIK